MKVCNYDGELLWVKGKEKKTVSIAEHLVLMVGLNLTPCYNSTFKHDLLLKPLHGSSNNLVKDYVTIIHEPPPARVTSTI